MTAACWCGGDLTSFDTDYLVCACGTLVRSCMPATDITRVQDEEHDLYGKHYWFAHQAALGLPDLDQRAVDDLHTRHLKWLRLIATFASPPAQVLEIGASHGGFLALLAMCGFDVTGIELSPWLVDYAKRTSGVGMLQGPLEDQQFAKRSFDLILLFDVLEHLPDPLATIGRCAQLLRKDGVLVIQTPRRVPDLTPAQLAATPFGAMLIPEHLFLFSEESARLLLKRSGLNCAVTEPPVFETDMILVAARQQPRRLTSLDGRVPTASTKTIDTLLALDDKMTLERAEAHAAYRAADRDRSERLQRLEELERLYQQADRDRIDRLQQVTELEALFKEADRDRIDRLRQVTALETLFKEADRDRVEGRRQLEALDARYREADRDRIERQRQIEVLDQRYRDADHDRTERQRQIETLVAQYREADRDRIERQRQIETLVAQYREADHDRIERQRQIETLDAQYREADRDRIERQRQIEALDQRYRDADRDRVGLIAKMGEIEGLYKQADDDRTSRLRTIAELEGRLRKADDDLAEQVRIADQVEAGRAALAERHQSLRAVADDHRNSRVYKALVRLGRWRGFDQRLRTALHESRLISGPTTFDHHWTLPSASSACGTGAVAVDLTAILPGGENGGAKLVALEIISAMARLAPDRQFLLLTSGTSHHEVAGLDAPNVQRRAVNMEATALSALLEEQPLSVLFCPMTASRFDDPRVPVVCLIHDLQYLTYPEFFDDADRRVRGWAFSRATSWADHVITPSQYVRGSVLQHSRMPGTEVTVIPHGVPATRLPGATEAGITETLERYGVERGRFFIYPANFWPHKNHLMLLIAFGKLCRTRPDLRLQLVLTGAGRPDQREVRDNVIRMGLEDRVIFPGYVPDAELAALMGGALALVFPSLYEGYGMPVVEAFAARCPVACSKVTSLPEVAGDAAEYFDPRKPDDIARVLERLATDTELTGALRRRGDARLQQLENWSETARRYLNVIEAVMSHPRRPHHDHLGGVFTDGWTTSSFVVAHRGGEAEVRFELENTQPVAVTLDAAGVEPITLESQRVVALRCVLPPAAGHVLIAVRPTFRPADTGQSTDIRRLGVRIRSCFLHRAESAPVDLVAAMTDV